MAMTAAEKMMAYRKRKKDGNVTILEELEKLKLRVAEIELALESKLSSGSIVFAKENSEFPVPEWPVIRKKVDVIDFFEQFWQAFPRGRRRKKADALKAWDGAVKKSTPDVIISAAREYSSSAVGQGQFVQMPATWLRGECWNDDRAAWNPAFKPEKDLHAGIREFVIKGAENDKA